ncbi:MAG: kynureninase [Cytophagales bacterium]|nr:kynureninase [Cytophagales bacterium]MCA6365775.1 kynureninase [Cytophagales bacterium]MCA6372855.1 kynureninase [Cytophagales bacterium]MCA6376114.1 kynureninase [Cytophagales bacterium]MCA6384130.1 kynureninase [Cytophagales bacterium]
MKFENPLAFAKKLDKQDPLKSFRKRFHLPKVNGKTAIYFTGNSLGLQPISTKKFINEEVSDWAALGVEGHVHAKRPWLYYHKFSKKTLAKLVGAKPIEVVAMNQLTVNLHLMMASFYRPTKQRFKIITEAGAFSSDQYAFESQLKFHGLDPETTLIELAPRKGEFTLRTADILQAIEENKEQVALVIFGAVQYYSGQFFEIKKITKAAHDAGAYAGFDLAHAIGNVPLHLHKDQVDFAVWCSYKYLNSGPGGVAGAFVHGRHANDSSLPRLAGWWGHHEKDRFQMKKGFIPMPGADGWQLSNFPVLSGAALLASLQVFEKAGIKNLRKKSVLLTGYLEFLLNQIDNSITPFSVITPDDPKQRGCQLSILMHQNGKSVFQKLTRAGIIADWREPGVIRVAPVPLYNRFEDVFEFVKIFKAAL